MLAALQDALTEIFSGSRSSKEHLKNNSEV